MPSIETQSLPPVHADTIVTPDSENEAALRQLSLQRLMAYGLDYGDAVHLRTMVSAGMDWKISCTALANVVLDRLATASSAATQRNLQYRASALIRMSQMMMLSDNHERRAAYRHAADLFEEAGRHVPGWTRVTVPTGSGILAGWLLSAGKDARPPVVLVIGGVEGWAMDWESFGHTFADRGLSTLLIDGPGQGESRLLHRHYLSPDWRTSLSDVLDYLSGCGFTKIGILGNSMGGTFATHLASHPRVAACCNNGGIEMPILVKARTKFFPKMEAFCRDRGDADAAWGSLEVTSETLNFGCPYLIVQGGADPLVSLEESARMFKRATSPDKSMRIISGGDHCIYNHPADKNNLIGDWFVARLAEKDR